MINDLKLGLKMFRYGRYLKTGIPWSIIILVIGLLIHIWDRTCELGGLPGDVLMMTMAVYIFPTVYSLRSSNLVLSSPAQKRVWTSMPAAVTCFYTVILYLVLSLSNGILMTGHPEYISVICIGTVYSAGAAALIMITASLYAYFWMAVTQAIGICCLNFFERNIVSMFRFVIFDNSPGSFALALVIGLVIILLGGLGQYGVSLLVYKKFMPRYSK